VFVTGADGFVGSHLAEELVRAGHEVRAFVYYNSFNSWGWLDAAPPEILKAIDVFAGDIRDASGVRLAMKGVEGVVHLAALIGIPYSYESPESYVDTNVRGTVNVLQAAREVDAGRVIHTSTSEVYGTAQFVPITEAHPLRAQSPYAATKIAADQMAYSFYASFGLPVVIARPFNIYGPRQSARAVIPTIVTQIASGQRQIKLGATSPTRDFNYVRDTVAGLSAALLSDQGLGEVVNIGSNFEISIEDTARLIADVMAAEVDIVADEARLRPENSEVERLWADNSKAEQLFGWRPAYGGREGFRRGLAETAEWFQDPANLARYKVNRYNI
jgi:NAD dependent epimerase/dehydratase